MLRATQPPDSASGDEVIAWFRVSDDIDRFVARSGVKEIALGLGFEPKAAQEMMIVASELCSNILKHATRGWIRCSRPNHPRHGRGLQLEAGDCGRPFKDFELAQRDGHDDRGPIDPRKIPDRGGIAAGLGAVRRFSHSVTCRVVNGGKIVEVVRFLREPRAPLPDAGKEDV